MTYLEIGVRAGLFGRRLTMYVAYMTERWADTEAEKCADGYAMEWAIRFREGEEMPHSDAKGRAILTRMYLTGE